MIPVAAEIYVATEVDMFSNVFCYAASVVALDRLVEAAAAQVRARERA